MSSNQPKTAIVTGASKRVGRAIADALIDDGWKVVAHVHREEDEIPDGAVRAVADLADPDCAERVMAVLDGLPPPRLLVNSAARFALDSPGAFDPHEHAAHSAINLRAPILLAEAFARLQDGADALIVNLTDAKVAAPNADYLSYTLSKQGLQAATELLARAYAEKGIRVNAIAPTLMLRSPGQSEQNYRAQHANNPLRRGVTPSDVVAALRYLIDAPTVTGQTLLLDSGHRFMGLGRDVQFLGNE